MLIPAATHINDDERRNDEAKARSVAAGGVVVGTHE
jgi:hypothetical protein